MHIGLAHDVLKLCWECEICAEDHVDPSISSTSHSEAYSPGFKYSADIGEIGGHPHLVVVDYFSFAIFEWPLPSLAASSVITAFKTVFSDSGVPVTLITDNATCFANEEFAEFTKDWNFIHVTSSPRYPKGNAHAEKAIGMVKQIYTRCADPLFRMLVLKTVPLLDVKELPDKLFFGHVLNTNLPKAETVHKLYEDRYIHQDDNGDLPSTRNFMENDPVWVKVNDHLPWKPGIVVNVCPNHSFDVQIDGKMYCHNTHHLTRRYPRVPISKDDGPMSDGTPQRVLQSWPKVKMPQIPVQATMQKDFAYL